MRFILWLAVWLRRFVILAILFVLALGGPVAWVEFSCTGTPLSEDHTPLLPEADQRNEALTYLSFPKEYLIDARQDYARVIQTEDPHNYGYFGAVTGYWSSLCDLAQKARQHGEFAGDVKRDLYISGAEFTGEMVLKGLYEHTVGRIMTMVRGEDRAPLDDLSAQQAQRYALSLDRAPWYDWNFSADATALWDAKTGTPRDWERAIALRIENTVKQAAAGLVRSLSGSEEGQSATTTRAVVSGLSPDALSAIPGVSVTGQVQEGAVIETQRGAAFTNAILDVVRQGGTLVEVAGNDDILVAVATSERRGPAEISTVTSVREMGTDRYIHLLELKTWGMANRLKEFEQSGISVERIYDY